MPVFLDRDGRRLDQGLAQVAMVERPRSLREEPVVVDVSLDGSRMEDVLVPLAVRLGGAKKMRFADICAVIVHDTAIGASRPPSRAARAVMRSIARVLRLCGVRRLPVASAW